MGIETVANLDYEHILIGQNCNLFKKALFYKDFVIFKGEFFNLCFLQLFRGLRETNPRHFASLKCAFISVIIKADKEKAGFYR